MRIDFRIIRHFVIAVYALALYPVIINNNQLNADTPYTTPVLIGIFVVGAISYILKMRSLDPYLYEAGIKNSKIYPFSRIVVGGIAIPLIPAGIALATLGDNSLYYTYLPIAAISLILLFEFGIGRNVKKLPKAVEIFSDIGTLIFQLLYFTVFVRGLLFAEGEFTFHWGSFIILFFAFSALYFLILFPISLPNALEKMINQEEDPVKNSINKLNLPITLSFYLNFIIFQYAPLWIGYFFSLSFI